MTLVQVLNAAHGVLMEGLDEDAERRLDDSLMGVKRPDETQAEAFLRARGRTPARGAPRPTSFDREQKTVQGPPPMPPGIPLAPPGVLVREPGPTRGLEYLQAALGVAPKPSKAKPATPRGKR